MSDLVLWKWFCRKKKQSTLKKGFAHSIPPTSAIRFPHLQIKTRRSRGWRTGNTRLLTVPYLSVRSWMSTVEFYGPPSLSLDPSETWDSTRCSWLAPPPLCTGARIKRPRWRPVELNNRHQWSHGKIRDCEQSKETPAKLPPYASWGGCGAMYTIHDRRILSAIGLFFFFWSYLDCNVKQLLRATAWCWRHDDFIVKVLVTNWHRSVRLRSHKRSTDTRRRVESFKVATCLAGFLFPTS